MGLRVLSIYMVGVIITLSADLYSSQHPGRQVTARPV
eukprot:COSAG01_NODE_23541_length_811_cov_1.523876_1_plen_36_part_10